MTKLILIIICWVLTSCGHPTEACIGEVIDWDGSGVQTWYVGKGNVADEHWYINYANVDGADCGMEVVTIFTMGDSGEADDIVERRDFAQVPMHKYATHLDAMEDENWQATRDESKGMARRRM